MIWELPWRKKLSLQRAHFTLWICCVRAFHAEAPCTFTPHHSSQRDVVLVIGGRASRDWNSNVSTRSVTACECVDVISITHSLEQLLNVQWHRCSKLFRKLPVKQKQIKFLKWKRRSKWIYKRFFFSVNCLFLKSNLLAH